MKNLQETFQCKKVLVKYSTQYKTIISDLLGGEALLLVIFNYDITEPKEQITLRTEGINTC